MLLLMIERMGEDVLLLSTSGVERLAMEVLNDRRVEGRRVFTTPVEVVDV